MSEQSARVDVLTAEVRALMVGRRQVTLSVYRQLDVVDPDEIEPFGRVRDGKDEDGLDLVEGIVFDRDLVARHGVHVVGRCVITGTLVRASVWDRRLRAGAPDYPNNVYGRERWRTEWIEPDPHHVPWSCLPLIVLAGLR